MSLKCLNCKYINKMSSATKEVLKVIVNKFVTNGHSFETSNLIVKYFVGQNTMSIDTYLKSPNKSQIHKKTN